MDVLELLGFRKSEKSVYSVLSEKDDNMSVKEIARRTKMSERAVRYSVKKLLKKRFIQKKIFQGKRLMYKYTALPIKNAWNHFKEGVDKIIGKNKTKKEKRKAR